jgi:hypothetical protein
VEKQKDILQRINDNWVRLWVIKKLPSWEILQEYDYKSYTVKSVATNNIKQIHIVDKPLFGSNEIVPPPVEKIKEMLTSCV